MRRLLFLAFVAFTLCGCGDSNSIDPNGDTLHDEDVLDTGMLWDGHFVTEYLVPSKVEVADKGNGELYLKVSGDEYETCTDNKDTPNYKKAREFAELYGDVDCKIAVCPGLHNAIAYPIDKITIYCEKDFDAKHPAGEPMDDVVKLEFESYYEFIKNGFSYPDKINLGTSDGRGAVDYILNLGDIDANVATLVHICEPTTAVTDAPPSIHFASTPAEPGEYDFVLETTINGKVYKSEFSYTFE
ncbi:MAG: hypothetical protein IJ434_04625 [Alistipes sp.]|nr:hypothetical protein [Alistipes sp.]